MLKPSVAIHYKKILAGLMIILIIAIIVFFLYSLGCLDKLFKRPVPEPVPEPVSGSVPGVLVTNLSGKIIEIDEEDYKIEMTIISVPKEPPLPGEPPFKTDREIKVVRIDNNTKIIKIEVPKDRIPGQSFNYIESEISQDYLKVGDEIYAYKSIGFFEEDYIAETIYIFAEE